MDPTIFISAMAAVTESVGFAVTGSTSYIAPYVLARTWSTLDHVTQGRIAWNVVTSYSNSAAKAMGREQVMSAPERYAGKVLCSVLVTFSDKLKLHMNTWTSHTSCGKHRGKMEHKSGKQSQLWR